jgi:hypothetical protein
MQVEFSWSAAEIKARIDKQWAPIFLPEMVLRYLENNLLSYNIKYVIIKLALHVVKKLTLNHVKGVCLSSFCMLLHLAYPWFSGE